jgi:uncharacterized protein (DUF983 family)
MHGARLVNTPAMNRIGSAVSGLDDSWVEIWEKSTNVPDAEEGCYFGASLFAIIQRSSIATSWSKLVRATEAWIVRRQSRWPRKGTLMASDTHPDISRQPAGRLLWRALLLRCPNCGSGHLFTGFFKIKERCPNCGILLERGESDYFLGGYTLNLIAVELILALGFLIVVVVTWPNPPWNALQYGGVVLSILGAVLCYPFAKTTWLAVDLIFRPPHREDFITRVK